MVLDIKIYKVSMNPAHTLNAVAKKLVEAQTNNFLHFNEPSFHFIIKIVNLPLSKR